MSAFKPARRALGSLALVALAVTACGRTDLAARPTGPALAPQGERTSFTFSFTSDEDRFGSPCTGEAASGSYTLSGQTQRLTDAAGGVHFQVDAEFSGTYLGEAGTTFTSSGAGHFHVNLPSSGAVNRVELVNGRITGSDGTIILVKDRLMFVMDAGGVVRVDGNNFETNALRCQKG